MALPKKGRGRKGPQPKTTCPTCGRKLSQFSLKKHQGGPACSEAYWVQTLRPQFVMPPGYARIEKPELGWTLMRVAGFFPGAAPMRKAVIWEDGLYGNASWPAIQAIGPTWLAIVLRLLNAQHAEAVKAKRKQKRADKLEVDLAVTYNDWVERLEGVYGVLWQDAILLLQRFTVAADGDALALAMAAELEFVARDTACATVDYDIDKVLEVTRRWASDILSNL